MSHKDLCQEILKHPAATPSAVLTQRVGCVSPPGRNPELRRFVEIGALNLWRLIGLDAIRPDQRVL
jgi:hypothetical protein